MNIAGHITMEDPNLNAPGSSFDPSKPADPNANRTHIYVKAKPVRPDEPFFLPAYAHPGDACFDICASSSPDDDDSGHLYVGSSIVIKTNLSFEIPVGYGMFIFSRSGQGFNSDVRLANSVGVIDSGYRGELMIKLRRDGMDSYGRKAPLMINDGDRIAQGMILPLPFVQFIATKEDLAASARGAGGFGSTGQARVDENDGRAATVVRGRDGLSLRFADDFDINASVGEFLISRDRLQKVFISRTHSTDHGHPRKAVEDGVKQPEDLGYEFIGYVVEGMPLYLQPRR